MHVFLLVGLPSFPLRFLKTTELLLLLSSDHSALRRRWELCLFVFFFFFNWRNSKLLIFEICKAREYQVMYTIPGSYLWWNKKLSGVTWLYGHFTPGFTGPLLSCYSYRSFRPQVISPRLLSRYFRKRIIVFEAHLFWFMPYRTRNITFGAR